MHDSLSIVVDVGKTHAKVSLWDSRGQMLDLRVRANRVQHARDYLALDTDGIEVWLIDTLAECAKIGHVRHIIPVGHGAAAAIVCNGKLLLPPMDYEQTVPEDCRLSYAAERDPFAATGSPFLPGALNLGMQLHRIESLYGPLAADATILPWPQYWAWRLSGVMAAEVSSLGCHTDLWRPGAAKFSDLAIARGWDQRFAPLRQAGDVLGSITTAVAQSTGLPADCRVLCGLHDSNAALYGARGHGVVAQDASVLSTGTWFVAMRTPGISLRFDTATLPEHRDCLINVDIDGRPIPSARFMGGRECELILGLEPAAATSDPAPDSLLHRVAAIVERKACALPTFAPGVGPFPSSAGHLINRPECALDLGVVASLYLAQMSAVLLELIGSTDCCLLEGRFAEDPVFTGALATIRPQMSLYVCEGSNDLAYGALRLVDSTLAPPTTLRRVEPLDVDLAGYAEYWRQLVDAPPRTRTSLTEDSAMRVTR